MRNQIRKPKHGGGAVHKGPLELNAVIGEATPLQIAKAFGEPIINGGVTIGYIPPKSYVEFGEKATMVDLLLALKAFRTRRQTLRKWKKNFIIYEGYSEYNNIGDYKKSLRILKEE